MVSYAESEVEDEDEEVFDPSTAKSRRRRAVKRRKTDSEDEDDIFDATAAGESDVVDEGMLYMFLLRVQR